MKKLLFILPFIQFICANSVLAQGPGSAGVLFLLIQPSLRANGMGGAAVASGETDAIGIAFNLARLGVAALDNYFVAEFYPNQTQWLPHSRLIFATLPRPCCSAIILSASAKAFR